MEYIRQSISDDEELIHVAQFHWMYVFIALFNIVFSIIIAIIILIAGIKLGPLLVGGSPASGNFMSDLAGLHPGIKILSFIVLLMGLLKFAQMMIIKATTEIGVTDIRLVYKRGLVARAVGEINIDRVEGVNVIQGILGRLFGYGRVMVRGMGVGEVILPPIAQPIRFKKAIEHARTKAKRKNNMPVDPND